MGYSSVTVTFEATATGPVTPAALLAAMVAVPLPTGPTGDITQVTQATLATDTNGIVGKVAHRTLGFTYPDTTIAAVIPLTGPVKTVVDAPVAAGAHAVTPESMKNIVVGSSLVIDTPNPTLTETVVVTATTATTFTATFANAHGEDFTVSGNGEQVITPASMVNIYGAVSATVDTSILAGAQTVTPDSMVNIEVGVPLAVQDPAAPELDETVIVTGVTATTFTATYANPHAAGWTVNRTASQLQVDFEYYTTTSTTTLAPGTDLVTPAALGPIVPGMYLIFDLGTPTEETVVVIGLSGGGFTAKFKFAHAPGATIQTQDSVPGSFPENVEVLFITATTFTTVFQFAHDGGSTVGGVVNAMFPGKDPTNLKGAYRGLYQTVFANAMSTKVTSVDPVVTIF